MSKVRQINEEIDLVTLIETLWNGKWKIVSAIIFSVLSVAVYQYIQPSPSYERKAEIRSISTIEAEKYRKLNTLKFFNVSANQLKALYIEQLDNSSIFEEAIRGVLDPKDYDNELEFNQAVNGLASSYEIINPPLVLQDAVGFIKNGNYKDLVSFSFIDLKGWNQVLSAVNLQANLAVQRDLQQQFENTLLIAQQKREFALEDNAAQIENALEDYDRKTTDKLAYLTEQAAIARTVGLAEITIDSEIPLQGEKVVVNFGKNEAPFYLRGYKAIEQEIKLIKSRVNKRSFVNQLYKLETQKRALTQDKSIERAEVLFALTPIASNGSFSAGKLVPNKEDVIQNRKLTALVFAALVGGFLGTVFVTFSTAFRSRKEK